MNTKRKVEVFSAGCPVCEEAVGLVNHIACPSCDVEVLDMRNASVAKRAKDCGVRALPAVVVNGKLVECCTNAGMRESSVRAAGVGIR